MTAAIWNDENETGPVWEQNFFKKVQYIVIVTFNVNTFFKLKTKFIESDACMLNSSSLNV